MNKIQWKNLYREERLLKKEIWKDIQWYEWFYQVSNLWRVKSLFDWRHKKLRDKILKHSLNNDWYVTFTLSTPDRRQFLAHRLVAFSFLRNEDIFNEVNHKNWIKIDNLVYNLEWCDRKINTKHAYDFWLNKKRFWKLNKNSKSVLQFSKENLLIKEWDSISDVTRELWINSSHISTCCLWRRKKTWWFIWRYL